MLLASVRPNWGLSLVRRLLRDSLKLLIPDFPLETEVLPKLLR
jgi:hypothetical protein